MLVARILISVPFVRPGLSYTETIIPDSFPYYILSDQ